MALRAFLIGTVVLASRLLVAEASDNTCPVDGTPRDAEGPFYVEDSPMRERIASEQELADPTNVLHVQGHVYGNDCVPMANALVEPWYAGAADGYSAGGDDMRYRGRIYTNECGFYSYTQSFPRIYSGRPIRHVHFRVSDESNGGHFLTTQMYFEDDPSNSQVSFTPDDMQFVTVQENDDGSRKVVFDLYLDKAAGTSMVDCSDTTPGAVGAAQGQSTSASNVLLQAPQSLAVVGLALFFVLVGI